MMSFLPPLKIMNMEQPGTFCFPGGYSGFQVTGMIEWGQKSKPKKIPRASKEPKKSLDQKLTPQNPMPNFRMTTSQRFKCVPQILRLLSIHIFKLLFKVIAYSFRSICRQAGMLPKIVKSATSLM